MITSVRFTVTFFSAGGPAQRRSVILSIILMTLTSSTGCFVFMQYAESIFRDAGSNISPEMSSIVMATIQLGGTYMASFLVEKAGRKPLIIGSAFGASTCLVIMGIHAFIRAQNAMGTVDSFSWIPLACLSGLVFIASHGSATLPYVVICEILEQKVVFCGHLDLTFEMKLTMIGIYRFAHK